MWNMRRKREESNMYVCLHRDVKIKHLANQMAIEFDRTAFIDNSFPQIVDTKDKTLSQLINKLALVFPQIKTSSQYSFSITLLLSLT